MIRAEALARGRLFSRCLILLAVLLAACALISDAMAAGAIEPMVVPATDEDGGLSLPLEPFREPLPAPLEGWEVAIRTDGLFSVIDPQIWPFGIKGSSGRLEVAATTDADLVFGGLCFLAAGTLLWAAGRQRPPA